MRAVSIVAATTGLPATIDLRPTVRAAVNDLLSGTAAAAIAARFHATLAAVADAMIGNSSCGLIEASFTGTPVLHVGQRNARREHGDNVVFARIEREIRVLDVTRDEPRALERAADPRGNLLHQLPELTGARGRHLHEHETAFPGAAIHPVEHEQVKVHVEI